MADRPENTIVGHVQNGFLARLMHYSPPAVVVWLALANRADSDGLCYPSITTIQGDTGLSRATVFRSLDKLAQAGEISIVPGRGPGNPTNHYRIEGGIRNELVQEMNQFKRETQVVQSRDSGGLRNELKPNKITKRKNQTGHARFAFPSLEEVKAFCLERKNHVDAQTFIDHYTSNGWMVGKNKMCDWKAAVRTWERNGISNGNGQTTTPPEPIRYRG